MLKRILILAWLAAAILTLALPRPTAAQTTDPLVVVITADSPVAPPMEEYIARGIRTAEQRNAEMLVIQLNTPGGTVGSMFNIVKTIRGSNVPVVVYVQPRGGMAASAGTLITLAGHASAMAPETTIGAASPIGPTGEDLDKTSERKLKEDLKAQVRTLAERRGERAIRFAESTIEEAKAANANEALELGLVDFVANDLDQLLQQLDGFTVFIHGTERTLNTQHAEILPLPLSISEALLQFLADANIVFLLLSVGSMAILIELASPGGWIAGTIGVVCLALATYGLGVLPVNWFGLVFFGLSFALFILDIKAPTHGALTLAAIGSMVAGALILFNSPGTPEFLQVSVPLVLLTSLVMAALFLVVLTFALRAQKAPVRTGNESLLSRTGTVRSDLAPRGNVQLGGELWSAELAEGEEHLPKGTRVEVVKVEGIRLYVRKAKTIQ